MVYYCFTHITWIYKWGWICIFSLFDLFEGTHDKRMSYMIFHDFLKMFFLHEAEQGCTWDKQSHIQTWDVMGLQIYNVKKTSFWGVVDERRDSCWVQIKKAFQSASACYFSQRSCWQLCFDNLQSVDLTATKKGAKWYPLVMTNSSPWLSHGPNRNWWLTVLKNAGSFHGKLLVITRW